MTLALIALLPSARHDPAFVHAIQTIALLPLYVPTGHGSAALDAVGQYEPAGQEVPVGDVALNAQ